MYLFIDEKNMLGFPGSGSVVVIIASTIKICNSDPVFYSTFSLIKPRVHDIPPEEAPKRYLIAYYIMTIRGFSSAKHQIMLMIPAERL